MRIRFFFLLCTLFVGSTSFAQCRKPNEPVLWVHGLASSAATFTKHIDALKGCGLVFGGYPTVDTTGEVRSVHPKTGFEGVLSEGDFYAMNFSDFGDAWPSQNLSWEEQGGEIGLIIAAINQLNGTGRVDVVGHSMGGVGSRAYLQDLGEHTSVLGGVIFWDDVKKLITFGSPHRGSWGLTICGAFCSAAGIHPSSVVVGNLNPFTMPFTPINQLSTHPLAPNVSYVSIVAVGTTTVFDLETGDGLLGKTTQNLATLAGSSINHTAHFVDVVGRPDCDKGLPQTHTCETTDAVVFNTILDELGVATMLVGFETGDLSAWSSVE